MAPTNQQLERRGGQALVDAPKSAPVDGLITSAKDLVAQLTKAQQQFNVIAPVISTSKLADGYAASMSVVPIDLTDNAGDVYSDNLMKGKVALTKLSLMRICAALGVSWLKTTRLDTGRERFYWNVQVEGEYIAADGTRQRIVASKEVDFRDGSTQIAGKTPAEISRMRQHGQQLGETKAQLRAVRTLGVKSNYERHQLEKPFLIVRFSWVPDMTNPEVAKLVASSHLGIAGLLYGPGPAATAPDSGEGPLPRELGGPAEPAPKQVGGGTSAPAVSAPAPASEGPGDLDDSDDGEVDARPLYAVERVLDRNDAGDYQIFLAGGLTVLTTDGAVAKAAARAKKVGHSVRFDSAGGRIDALDVVDAPATPVSAAREGELVDDGNDGLRTIADVQEKAGETNGRKWVKFTIVAEGGESWVTFSATFAADAKCAKADGWKVRIEEKANEKYPDQMDLVSRTPIDPRQGSLLAGRAEAKY